MASYSHFYIIKIQYLGFRLHGWQKQPNAKTVQQLIEKTLKYVLEDQEFRTLGCSRTDSMVSANQSAFELFLKSPLEKETFLQYFNRNLPADIRALEIIETNSKFNIIQHSKTKEYQYLFSMGEKYHPFCAPFMTHIFEGLDIPLMQKAAKVFIGTLNFKNYCYKPTETTTFVRTILESEIVENTVYQANFFPPKSYMYKVVGTGFLRHQIRIMMGALFNIGQHKITIDELEASLIDFENHKEIGFVAPASGLMLNKVDFN